MTTEFVSQIIPLNKGVPLLSPISWPYISAPYNDSTHRFSDVATIKSAFTNVSLNPRIITIGNTNLYVAGVKSINCYEIHDAPTATVNGNSVFEVSNFNGSSILNRLYPFNTNIESYLTVSASSSSNRINLEGQGALSNLISSGSLDANHDYFVLVHADDAKKHHLAKITELHTYEVFGDGFDFTPAFDGDIPKNTKISIYKGPAASDTHIVAVGYGLLGDADDSDGRHDTYTEVSKPTFYFYEERCDKDKLLPNTKYRIIKNQVYFHSSTLKYDFGLKNSSSQSDVGSTPNVSAHGTTVHFLTTSDYGGYIIDKTGYSQYGELVDSLADADRTITVSGSSSYSNAISNRTPVSSWSSNTYNLTTEIELGTWSKSFVNTMRDSHTVNGASSGDYDSNIKRVVTYENSDLKNYHLPHIQYIDLFDSVASVGNYMEMKFPDANKILNLKLKNFDNILVKKEINSEDYSGAMNVQLPGVVTSSTTGWSLTFSKLTVKQDIRKIWGSSLLASENTNKLRVGDFIFAGDFSLEPTIGTDGYEQIFTISHYRNVRTDNTWTNVSSNWDLDAITNGNAFVYPFMNKEAVIVTGFNIDTEYDGSNIKRNGNTITGIDNFISNTEIFVRDKELTGFTFDLNYGDKNLNYLKPTNTTYDGYQIRERIARTSGSNHTVANVPELYSYINGDILHMDKVFDGYIEAIKSNINGGVVSYDISGRDYTNRLLDSVVNKEYTHTKDYIFTTVSPEADMNTQSGTVYIQDFDMGSTTIVVSSNSTSSGPTLEFGVGDVIYCTLRSQTKLLGIVSATANKIGGSGGFTLGTYWDTTLNQHVAFTSTALAIEITLTEPTLYSSYNKDYGAINLKYSKKSTSLGKALSANTSDSIFPTTLTGCSNKGIIYRSGEKISITTGAYDSDLVETSANKSKFSTGYPISNISGSKPNTNFADYRFSISSDKDETNITQNDTISSPTEFAVVGTQVSENESILSLAPIFPVVLAKTSSNTSDTRISNGNGLYFVNTQGLSNGGFLHLLDSETSSVGASITFRSPGYKDFSSGVNSIDYRLEDNFGAFIWRYSGLQLADLFWDSEYLDKVWDMKKDEIFTNTNLIVDTGWFKNLMYGEKSPVKGYAIAQRINYDGVGVDFGTENDFTNHYQKLGSPESRDGFYPIIGSRFWDIDKISDTLASVDYLKTKAVSQTFEDRYNSLRSYYPQISRRGGKPADDYSSWYYTKSRQSFESFDRNTENFYLFSTGDIYPDSYKRTNSIGYANRNLQKYSVVLKSQGSDSLTTTNHENYKGSTPSNLVSDSSFQILPIQSSSVNTSELKRFGLVRLIEATYDWHFNEVDYENLPTEVKTELSSYSVVAPAGSIIEHEPELQDLTAVNYGEPSVTGFGIEYISSTTTYSVTGEGYAFYQVDRAPKAGASKNIYNGYLYTDFINFNTGSTNKFGEYDIEELGRVLDENPHDNSVDAAWVSLTGVITASDLVGRVDSGLTDAGRTVNTYNNVAVSSSSGANLKLSVVVNGSGTVTAITPYEYASALITGVTVKHRGSGYTTSNSLTIAGSSIGGGADVVITLDAADISTEHRIYVRGDAFGRIIYKTNIGSTSTLGRNYTGFLKYNDIANVKAGESPALKINDGSFKNALSNSASGGGPRLMNLGFIIGKTGDNNPSSNGDLAYLGQNELSPSVHNVGEKQTGYDLILPIYFSAGGNRTNKYDKFFKELPNNNGQGGRLSTKSYDNNFELSRVINELAQWDEDTIISYTPDNAINRLGIGASQLYTDTIGVIKNLKMDNHTKIEFTEGRNRYQVELSNYDGSTIPNLHVSYLEGDRQNKYFSIKYAFDFTNAASWKAQTVGHTGSGMPSSVGSLGLFDADRYGFASNTDNMCGAEFYFKMVLNTGASNISVYDTDSITQTTNIPSSTSLKSNTQIKGRAIIRITTPDLTNHANNGKDAASPTDNGPFNKNNLWINFVNDLTGYYLASEPTDRKVNNTTPSNIHQIINHTINTTGATITHYLEIDNVTYSNTAQLSTYYRLMRIAKDCTFQFTPNNIEILNLNKKYTKNPNRRECYTVVGKHNSSPVNGGIEAEDDVTNEAVLSMYALLDVDGTGDVNNRQHVLRRTIGSMITTDGSDGTITTDTSKNMLITDGIKDERLSVSFSILNNKRFIKLSEMYNMKGVVSFGEIFDVSLFNSSINTFAKRCNIASTVDVVEEVDEIVNEILEENNVQFETNYDTTSDMYFIGPNYTGANGFHVINNLLGLKNKRLLVNGKTIEGRDLLSDNLYTNIILSENDESEGVVNLRIDTSSYDFYNEVIVYGDNARGVARNNSSIRELGRKITLEITDLSLQSFKVAQDKANKELEIVEILSSQVSFNVAKTRIPYLRAGQVITLDYPSFDVPTAYYQVLEIEDNFGQLPRITVGKYTQSLASRFADLSLKTREIQGVQRGNRFQDGNTIVQEAVIPEIQELNLKIIKTGLSSSTLGFSNTLGFDSDLGIETSESLSETVIYNEDLTE